MPKFDSRRVLHAELEVHRKNPVTELPMRRMLVREIGRHLRIREGQRIKTAGFRSFSLVKLDTNGLHLLNHLGGHSAGDTGLRLVGDVVKRHATANSGRAFHLGSGGDEFVLLLPFASRRRVERIRDAMLADIQSQVSGHANRLLQEAKFGARAGIATFGVRDAVGKGHLHYPLTALAKLHPEGEGFMTAIMSIPDATLNQPRLKGREHIALSVARLFAPGKTHVTEAELLAALASHLDMGQYRLAKGALGKRKA